MKKITPGFSLIELMITVSIIGILTIIAIPSYKGYIKRARFAEVIASTAPIKTAIALALQEGNPASEITNGNHGIPEKIIPTKNLASIIVKNAMIIATATKLIDNITYILKPDTDGTYWQITGTCVKAGLCVL